MGYRDAVTSAPGGPVDPLDQRIGDSDRAAALTTLGEHLTAGRLDLQEYDARSAQVTTARTQRDLIGLFTDLPGPTPAAQAQVAPRPAYQAAASTPSIPAPTSDRRKQLASAIGGITVLLCVIAYFSLRGAWDQAWLVFLAVPLAGLVAQVLVRDQTPGT